MSVLPLILALVSLVVWVVLTFFRSAFWQVHAFEDEQVPPSAPEKWPSVVAVVPARNEARSIERVLSSLVGQEYGGPFQIIVVDDHSGPFLGDTRSKLFIFKRAQLPEGATEKREHHPDNERNHGE